MKKRTAISTEGKTITFQTDNDYYVVGDDVKEKVFNTKTKFKYCVAYTKVKHDCGYREENRWGYPCSTQYDNGLIGYQNFNFFDNREEALDDYNHRKELTPKVGTQAYADVFFIENV